MTFFEVTKKSAFLEVTLCNKMLLVHKGLGIGLLFLRYYGFRWYVNLFLCSFKPLTYAAI